MASTVLIKPLQLNTSVLHFAGLLESRDVFIQTTIQGSVQRCAQLPPQTLHTEAIFSHTASAMEFHKVSVDDEKGLLPPIRFDLMRGSDTAHLDAKAAIEQMRS